MKRAWEFTYVDHIYADDEETAFQEALYSLRQIGEKTIRECSTIKRITKQKSDNVK